MKATYIMSMFGALEVEYSERGIRRLSLVHETPADNDKLDNDKLDAEPIIEQLKAALRAYSAGDPQALADIPLDLVGTEFQKSVWESLRNIPFAEVRSYGSLARQLGRPKAARAVGAACGRNPVLILVPCHRVLGSSGSLTGFAAGLDTKAQLLAHEAGLSHCAR